MTINQKSENAIHNIFYCGKYPLLAYRWFIFKKVCLLTALLWSLPDLCYKSTFLISGVMVPIKTAVKAAAAVEGGSNILWQPICGHVVLLTMATAMLLDWHLPCWFQNQHPNLQTNVSAYCNSSTSLCNNCGSGSGGCVILAVAEPFVIGEFLPKLCCCCCFDQGTWDTCLIKECGDRTSNWHCWLCQTLFWWWHRRRIPTPSIIFVGYIGNWGQQLLRSLAEVNTTLLLSHFCNLVP